MFKCYILVIEVVRMFKFDTTEVTITQVRE